MADTEPRYLVIKPGAEHAELGTLEAGTCPAIIGSGPHKGQRCGRVLPAGEAFCAYHNANRRHLHSEQMQDKWHTSGSVFLTKEFRANLKTTMRAIRDNPNHPWLNEQDRKRKSEMMKACCADPNNYFGSKEHKDKLKAYWKKTHLKKVQKHKAKMIAGLRTPKFRAEQSARIKALWQDPDYRAMMLTARKKAKAKGPRQLIK